MDGDEPWKKKNEIKCTNSKILYFIIKERIKVNCISFDKQPKIMQLVMIVISGYATKSLNSYIQEPFIGIIIIITCNVFQLFLSFFSSSVSVFCRFNILLKLLWNVWKAKGIYVFHKTKYHLSYCDIFLKYSWWEV